MQRMSTEQIRNSFQSHIVDGKISIDGIVITINDLFLSSSECIVCADASPNAIMVFNNNSCGHVCCSTCIERLPADICSECRQPFSHILYLPNCPYEPPIVLQSIDILLAQQQALLPPPLPPPNVRSYTTGGSSIRNYSTGSGMMDISNSELIPAFLNHRHINSAVDSETHAFITYNSNNGIGSLIAVIGNGASVIPNVAILCIDISGSMQGDRILNAKTGFIEIIKNLDPHTIVTIIAFSSYSYQLFGAQFVTSTNRDQLINFVHQLYAGGSTNLIRALNSIKMILEDISEKLTASGISISVEELDSILVIATDGEPDIMPSRECILNTGIKHIQYITLGDCINAEDLLTVFRESHNQNVSYICCNDNNSICQMANSFSHSSILYSLAKITIQNGKLEMSKATHTQNEQGIEESLLTSANIRSGESLVFPFTFQIGQQFTTSIEVISSLSGESTAIQVIDIGQNPEFENEGFKKIMTKKYIESTTAEELQALLDILDHSTYPSTTDLQTMITTKLNLMASSEVQLTMGEQNLEIAMRMQSSSSNVSRSVSSAMRQLSSQYTNDSEP